MRRFLPALDWLPAYRKSWLFKDLSAGLTLGIILIPQGMAYAMLAGLPPVYGLYASLVPLVIYTFLGSSRQLAVGPVAMDSILVAAGLSAMAVPETTEYIVLAIFLAFFTGFIQLILGLLRMGFLVNFLSRPVISGFTSAAAIIIIFSQLKHLLGLPMANSAYFHRQLANIWATIAEMSWTDATIGILSVVLIMVFRRLSPRIPGILVVVVLGIVAVFAFGLEAYGIHVVGAIPKGMPHFELPQINFRNAFSVWPIALTLALVGYLEAISIGKSLEEKSGKESIDNNQELVALGTANLIGSLFQSYSVTGSFSRSAINSKLGAKSTLSLLFSAALVLIALLFLTPLFYYLPRAVLASIIMVSVVGLIDVAYPKILWRYRKDEFAILTATFLITLFVGIPQGILVGVLLSLLLMVYQSSKPHFVVLGRVGGTEYFKNVDRFGSAIELRDDLLIVRFDSQLYFGNKDYFKKRMYQFIAAKGPKLEAVILNAESINYIDSTAVRMLVRLIADLKARGLQFYITSAPGPTRDIIFRGSIIKVLDKEFLFARTKEAVDYFDDVKQPTEIEERVAYENRNSRK